MKRIVSLILCAVLVIGMLPAVPVHAATNVAAGICGDNVTWILDDEGTLTISGSGAMEDYPGSTYAPWYEHRTSVTTVFISSGVTSIGGKAFYDCTALKNVSIPDTVTAIGYNAFLRCSVLSTISLPDSISHIDEKAFASTGLTCIIIPSGVSVISGSAFENCSKLRTVVIPESVTSIGYAAFYNCDLLDDVVIPASVTSIENLAFDSCNGLDTIWFEGAAPSFGNSTVFYGVEATAYYPGTDYTWTTDVLKKYGGNITWKSYIPYEILPDSDLSSVIGRDDSIVLHIDGDLNNISTLYVDGSAVNSSNYTISSEDSTITFNVSYLESLSVSIHRVRVHFTDGFATGIIRILPTHDHSFVAGETAKSTCTERGYTVYTCESCGDVKTEYVDALGHDWQDATCVLPETCARCGETRGEEKGHSWSAATCTAPKMCTSCGLSEGEALGHTWLDATCTAPMHCATCGLTSGEALGHNYVDGICTRCGESDSAYVPPVPTVDGVYRIAGADRIETSISIANALKETLGVEKFSNIVVASALNFPDALAGSYLAALKDAPILLTYDKVHGQVAQYIAENLETSGTVYILGGSSAVSSAFEQELINRVVHYKRVQGSDRFGTNMAILNEGGVKSGQTILVCTAVNFADSLSVSATGMPILLVYGSLRPDQIAYLNRAQPGAIRIIGGTGAVSAALEEELKNYAPDVKRIYGANRHETSATVADQYFREATGAVIAYSLNFPDGLCGGPLAYALGAPLLLTVSGDKTPLAYTSEYGIRTGYVLGSDNLVNDTSVREIFAMSAGAAIPVK